MRIPEWDDEVARIEVAQAATHGPTPDRPAVCEDCGLNYEVDAHGVPVTGDPYTCDDCGGYVEAADQ